MYWNPSFYGNCLCVLTGPQHRTLIGCRGRWHRTSPPSYNLNCVNKKIVFGKLADFKYTVAVCIFQENLLHTLHVIWSDLIMKYTLTFQSSLLSSSIRISISVHAGTEFLGVCWQWWISGTSQKCHPHSCCFIFVNKKKSQGANLGEYGEYGATNLFLSAEICCTDGAVYLSALLQWISHSWFCYHSRYSNGFAFSDIAKSPSSNAV